MVAMKDALSKLDSAAKKLNETSDSINKLIEQLEARLRASRVGVSVWLGENELFPEPLLAAGELKNGDLEDFVERAGWALGFEKIDQQWHIAVRKVRLVWNPKERQANNEFGALRVGEGETVPLLKAPRLVRVEATAWLERLIEKIAERAEAFAGQIELAEGLVKDGMQVVRGAIPHPDEK